MTLQEWVDALAAELGVPRDDVDVTVLLDVARDAAHSIARPAAPLTTFLVGYAAGARGGGADTVRDLAGQAVRLALADTAPRADPAGDAAARGADQSSARADEGTS